MASNSEGDSDIRRGGELGERGDDKVERRGDIELTSAVRALGPLLVLPSLSTLMFRRQDRHAQCGRNDRKCREIRVRRREQETRVTESRPRYVFP
jgi:hypothetical protein